MNEIFRALASEKRRAILDWLRNPVGHFAPQTDRDLVEDGVCVLHIAAKLEVSQPTATEHLKVLHGAGLVLPKHIKQWTFYRRDEAGIELARNLILEQLT